MIKLPESIDKVICEIAQFPSIGRKTAQRLAFYLLKQPKENRKDLAESIENADEYTTCKTCFCLSEDNICPICIDPERNKKIICVVEEFLDLYAIEQSRSYTGIYHILGGVLSPIDNISASDIHMKELFERLDGVEEIIIATNPTMEGEATAMYIKRKVYESYPQIHITRIARGLPMGADLEFADSITLRSAFEDRKTL